MYGMECSVSCIIKTIKMGDEYLIPRVNVIFICLIHVCTYNSVYPLVSIKLL